MIITYKYRLKDRSAKKVLRQHTIACNEVWNFCAETHRETVRRWKGGFNVRWLSKFDLIHLTAGSSKELGIHGQTIQCICEHFVTARNKKQAALRANSDLVQLQAVEKWDGKLPTQMIPGSTLPFINLAPQR